MSFRVGAAVVALLLGSVLGVQGATYHVAPTGNDNNSGTSLGSAWLTIARANAAAMAGDLVIVHGGQYTDGIQPLRSGAAGNPITFQAATDEHVVLKVSVGVWPQSTHTDIIVDGFEVQARSHLAILSGVSRITIRNCVMYGGREDYNALLLSDASYCVIQNNYVDREDNGLDNLGGDGIKIAGASHHNLIEGNTVTHCEHIGISSALGTMTTHQSYNVIRNNISRLNHTNFSLQDGVQRTVFENNTGYYMGLVWTGGNGWCLQFTASSCIVRFNTLYDDTGTVYTGRQWPGIVGAATAASQGNIYPVLYNKIYNNTIYGETDQTEWQKQGWYFANRNAPGNINDNDFKNNIVGAAPAEQVYEQDAFNNFPALPDRYEGNLFWGGPSGKAALIRYETPSDIGSYSLAEIQRLKPGQWAASNLEGDPRFLNTIGQGPAKDFHLQSGSPAIDAGVHLTTATASGSGTTLVVADAGYFCDGWGIPGVEGDSIRIDSEAPVGITSVDYTTNTITLNSARSWTQGSRVFYYRSDRFKGDAPDIGAHESGEVVVTPPPARPWPPILLSPANAAGSLNTSVTLQWNPVQSAYSYQVQVARDPSFASRDIDESAANPSLALSGLSNATTYYWRVNATNGVGASDWSEVRSFATIDPANRPTNIILNGDFDNGLDPWLSFSNGQGDFSASAPGYNGDHAAKLQVVSTGDNIQVYQHNIPLTPNTRYLLRFAAYSKSGNDLDVTLAEHTSPFTSYGLSAVRFDLGTAWKEFSVEFVTSNFGSAVNDARLRFWFVPYAAAGDEYYIDNVVLAPAVDQIMAPVAVAPATGSADLPTNVTLRWNRSPGATGYAVEVSLDGSFTERVSWDTAVVDTQYRLSSLMHGTTYYWRVCSEYAIGTSPFTSASSFTTVAVQVVPKEIIQVSQVQQTSVTLLWPAVPGAVNYHLQVSRDSLFGTLIVDDSTLVDTLRTVTALDPATRYFARARAKGAEGLGAFGPLFSFITAAAPPSNNVPPDYVLEQNYPNPFNPSTKIRYGVPANAHVRIVLFNALGQQIKTLVDADQAAGRYEIEITSSELASGTYFYMFEAGSYVQTRKLLILK